MRSSGDLIFREYMIFTQIKTEQAETLLKFMILKEAGRGASMNKVSWLDGSESGATKTN